MPFIRKLKDGRWYVCRKAIEYDGSIGRYVKKAGVSVGGAAKGRIRTVFSTYIKNIKGVIVPCMSINQISFPRDWLGKKVRLIVEIVESAKQKDEEDEEETPTQG